MEKKVEQLLITLYNKIDNWYTWELDKLYSNDNMKNLKEEMTNISNTIKALLYENLLIENKEKNNVK
jgi:hypothetical protein